MALKDLTAEAMIAITLRWLTKDRSTIESEAALKEVLAFLAEAHDALVTTDEEVGTLEGRIAELTKLLTVADAFHDRKMRGSYYVLTGAAELADDPEEREALLGLRDRLMRDGLAGTQRTYREQAGNAERAREKFDADARDLASQIVVLGRSLVEFIEEWFARAAEIGDMNAERNQLASGEDDAVTRGDLHRARLNWVKAVNAFLTILDLASFDTETRDKLLADLRHAEKQAARDLAPAKPAADDADAPAEPVADAPEEEPEPV